MSGFINRTKGTIRQAVGRLTGNRALERRGQSDELKGQTERAASDVRHAAADVVKDAKAALGSLPK